MRSVVAFALLRLATWGVIWWLLILVGIGPVLSGLLAAFIAMLLSFLFLGRLRDAAAGQWQAADERRRERRGGDRDEDADAEDALLDRTPGQDTPPPAR